MNNARIRTALVRHEADGRTESGTCGKRSRLLRILDLFWNSCFGFGIYFEFRISNFGFPVREAR